MQIYRPWVRSIRLSNNEDFYYLNLLITITADNVDDLEWKVAEMKKLLLSQDMDIQPCSFCEEQAFLSSLPLVSLGADQGVVQKLPFLMVHIGDKQAEKDVQPLDFTSCWTSPS
mgnify:CR=1 FL=1